MGDICSDTQVQLDQMCRAYEKLRAKYPNHELLSLIELTSDEIHFQPEYFRRCVSEADTHNFQSDGRYTVALEAALRGEEYKLLDTHTHQRKQRNKSRRTRG